MIDILALPVFFLWLMSAYFNPALNLNQNGKLIIALNSSLVSNPVIKTSSGFVRGITKTVMASKVDAFLGVMSTNYYISYIFQLLHGNC